MVPNDIEKLVLHCTTMRLNEEQALTYLKANGHEMSRATYYRIKGRLQATKMQRIYEIGKRGFVEQHLERIDQLEFIMQELWKCYFREQSPSKKANILMMLVETQPYLSAYYDATRQVMKCQKPEEPVYHLPDFSNPDGKSQLGDA